MVILGIDPGIATVGFGIITAEGSVHKPVRYGVVSTAAGLRLSVRLAQIYDDVSELIKTFKPDAIAIEELFFQYKSENSRLCRARPRCHNTRW